MPPVVEEAREKNNLRSIVQKAFMSSVLTGVSFVCHIDGYLR